MVVVPGIIALAADVSSIAVRIVLAALSASLGMLIGRLPAVNLVAALGM